MMGAADRDWRQGRLLVRLVPSAAAGPEVEDGIEEDELSPAKIKGAAACCRCSLPRGEMGFMAATAIEMGLLVSVVGCCWSP
ncbi:hypothetical protein ACLOJK_014628 [Asimina triloba]